MRLDAPDVSSSRLERPLAIGVGLGLIGVGVVLLSSTLLVLVPGGLLSPSAARAYVATWSGPIMVAGTAILVYGLPLLAAVAAYYLTRVEYAPRRVLVAFLAGGLVFGVGEALLGVTLTALFATDPATGQSLVDHVSDAVTLGGRLVIGAGVGVLLATAAGHR